MLTETNDAPQARLAFQAECHTPDLLRRFLMDLEQTTTSREVWTLIVALGQAVELPYIDFICANSYANWRKTMFIRTSYDSTWLNAANADPEVSRWSYFRSHAISYLTPIAVGLEYADQFPALPPARIAVIEQAAKRGLRAGFSIPLRQGIPAQAALITFIGNHSRVDCDQIIRTHGWTLNVAALTAHQRYMAHFQAEFSERNHISDKQAELLAMIGRGLPDKQIANDLKISVSAVRQRMSTLSKRTGLVHRPELAALALSMGILPDPLYGPDGQNYEIMIEMDKPGVAFL